MNDPLKLLVIEDVPADFLLLELYLRQNGVEAVCRRIDSDLELDAALQSEWDLVISDYTVPGMDFRTTLQRILAYRSDLPVIMLSGSVGEETAVELLHQGMADFILKNHLARLPAAIRRALDETHEHQARKTAEAALQESEHRYRTLFETMLNGFAYCHMLFEDGRPSDFIYLDVNAAFEKQTGLKGVVGKRVSAVIPGIRESDPQLIERYGRVALGGKPEQFETYVEALKMWFFISVYCPQPEHFVAVFDVITERKLAEQALADSEKRFRVLIESAPDGISLLGVDGKIAYASPATQRILGYAPKTVIGTNPQDFTHPDDLDQFLILLNDLMQKPGGSFTTQYRFRHKDGSWRWLESTVSNMLDEPAIHAVVFNYRDITERKQAGEALNNEALRRRFLMQGSQDGIAIVNQQHQVVEANARFAEMLGYTPEEVLGLHTWDFEAAMTEAEIRAGFANLSDTSTIIETRHRRKDGTVYEAEVSLGGAMVGCMPMIFTITRDITARKHAESELLRLNRALKTLSAGNLALVRATSEDELLRTVTGIIVEQGGYGLAVVDYAGDDTNKTITPMSWSGFDGSVYWAKDLSWADTERGQLPISRTIRNGTKQICHDIASDPIFEPWRDEMLTRGYKANITLPLTGGGRTFGGLNIYSSAADAFNEEEVKLLEEMANDLAYGITTLRTRVAHEQHAVILRESLEQSIQTIASTVEARDPYTAGHQRRVGELATAIALEMGLPEDQVNGIHLAAIIHDLGKIHIPAEILSKPGKLTNIEYMLIKTHPQDAYDILKSVKFPWPIADIILQHHERLDGSGYPQGLNGGAILLEARILSVADVVEAISSHRPYRPGLGIDAALGEIIRGRDTQYDPQVVDNCVALFRERGYVISN
jgi:PAS domain S-box-containing protein